MGAALIVGLVAVGNVRVFVWAEKISEKFLLHHPYAFLLLAPLLSVLSWAVVYYWRPEAKGSGIPQVIASIHRLAKHNGEEYVKRLLGIRTILAKIASSLLCVLAGGRSVVRALQFRFQPQSFSSFPKNLKKYATID